MKFEKLIEANECFRKSNIFTFDLYISAISRGGKIIQYEYQRVRREKKSWQNRQKQKLLNQKLIDNYSTRFVSISTSYILTVCNLEDMFQALAKIIDKWITEHAERGKKPELNNISEKIHEFKAETDIYRFYRDKVFAHPARIKNWKEETELLRDTTLQIYTSGSMTIATNGYFTFGHVAVAHGSQTQKELESRRQNGDLHKYILESTPKTLDFIVDYKNLENHFLRWEQYICKLFDYLLSISEKKPQG